MRRSSIVLALLALLALAGCAQFTGLTDTGCPKWRDWPLWGVATPVGPLLFCGSQFRPRVVEHEWCHVHRMYVQGVVEYSLRYGLATETLPATSPEVLAEAREWACAEERACGYEGRHPVCE